MLLILQKHEHRPQPLKRQNNDKCDCCCISLSNPSRIKWRLHKPNHRTGNCICSSALFRNSVWSNAHSQIKQEYYTWSKHTDRPIEIVKWLQKGLFTSLLTFRNMNHYSTVYMVHHTTHSLSFCGIFTPFFFHLCFSAQRLAAVANSRWHREHRHRVSTDSHHSGLI